MHRSTELRELLKESGESSTSYRTRSPALLSQPVLQQAIPAKSGAEHVAVIEHDYELLDKSHKKDRSRLRCLVPDRISGWRVGVAIFTLICFVVLIVNISVTIWLVSSFKVIDGIGTAYEGDCKVASRWASGLHIVINVLSSILLSGSNYCMQRLTAPTRKDIDVAHANGQSLDVGVMSTKNLRAVRWKNVVLYSLLALSSVPLHFLYNSAIFKSITANGYDVVVSSESFLRDGLPVAVPPPPEIGPILDYFSNQTSYGHYSDASLFYNFTAAECLNAYTTTFVSSVADVLLITESNMSAPTVITWPIHHDLSDYHVYLWQNNSKNTHELNGWPGIASPDYWACLDNRTVYTDNPSPGCSAAALSKNATMNATSWHMENSPVRYCLARRTPEQCKIGFVVPILAVVIVCNLVKVVAMALTLYHAGRPLLTLGDALASFLEHPDSSTTSDGPLEIDFKGRHCKVSKREGTEVIPKPWRARQTRWYRAATKRRWALWCIPSFLILLITGILLSLALDHLSGSNSLETYSISKLSALGLGTLSPDAVTTTIGSQNLTLYAAVFVVNLPQFVVSILYFMLNGLYTCMLSGREWEQFSLHRKGLRVSDQSPKPPQTQSYYLQLPYWYSVPLLIASVLLHWLISQSIFLAVVEFVYENHPNKQDGITGCGYSPIAMIYAMILGGVMILSCIGLGFRRYNSNATFVGSSSAAISAACHPPEGDRDPAHGLLRWGALVDEKGEEIRQRIGHEDVGHCCLTTKEVTAPTKGRLYA